MTVDRTQAKLGLLPYRFDERTLRLAEYLDMGALFAGVPSHYGWDQRVPVWPVYGNDRLGDCVPAGVAHQTQLVTAAGGAEKDVTGDEVIAFYTLVAGYDPASGANDNGCVVLDAMNAWRTTGIGGHKIGAFAEVDITNHAVMEAAIWLFGGVGLGLNLPLAAQDMGAYWHKPHRGGKDPTAGSWGGHYVYAVDFNRSGMTVVSWGELIHMTWPFWNSYGAEAWSVLSLEFLNGTGQSPQGFDLPSLQGDLAQITRAA